MKEIFNAADIAKARIAIKAFETRLGCEVPTAVAKTRWRCVNGPHLVALVRAGAIVVNGKLVERAATGKVA